jgi:hypothetical protein
VKFLAGIFAAAGAMLITSAVYKTGWLEIEKPDGFWKTYWGIILLWASLDLLIKGKSRD